MTPPVRGHAGDALSALVDGELDAAAADGVAAHVAACPACAAELAEVRSARQALRLLPAVDPPPGFVAALLGAAAPAPPAATRPRRAPSRPAGDLSTRWRVAALNAVASVAAGLGLVLLGVGNLDGVAVHPRLADAVSEHSASLGALVSSGSATPTQVGDPGGTTSPTMPERSGALPAPYRAPGRLAGGYELVGGYRQDGVLHLLYRRGESALSVFEVVGRLDTDALPPGGRAVQAGRFRAWQWGPTGVDGRVVVVVEHDDLVLTVVGDEPGGAVLAAARSLPPPRRLTLLQRLRRAGASTLEELAPVSR